MDRARSHPTDVDARSRCAASCCTARRRRARCGRRDVPRARCSGRWRARGWRLVRPVAGLPAALASRVVIALGGIARRHPRPRQQRAAARAAARSCCCSSTCAASTARGCARSCSTASCRCISAVSVGAMAVAVLGMFAQRAGARAGSSGCARGCSRCSASASGASRSPRRSAGRARGGWSASRC